jgi:hypothetical protein
MRDIIIVPTSHDAAPTSPLEDGYQIVGFGDAESWRVCGENLVSEMLFTYRCAPIR